MKHKSLRLLVIFCIGILVYCKRDHQESKIIEKFDYLKNEMTVPKVYHFNDSLVVINWDISSDTNQTFIYTNGSNPYKKVKIKRAKLQHLDLNASVAFIDFNNNHSYKDVGVDQVFHFFGDQDSIRLNFLNKHLSPVQDSFLDTFYLNDKMVLIDFSSINSDQISCIVQSSDFRKAEVITNIKYLELDDKSNGILKEAMDNNEFIILDLWFVHCSACLRAMPKMNDLNEKNTGKIKVIAVNGIDSSTLANDIFSSFGFSHLENTSISRHELSKLGDDSWGFPRYIYVAKNGDILDLKFNINSL